MLEARPNYHIDINGHHVDPYCQPSRIDEANGPFLSSLYPFFHSPCAQTTTSPSSPRPVVAVRKAALSGPVLQSSAEPGKRARGPVHVEEFRSGPALADVVAAPHNDFEVNSEVRGRRVAQWQAEAEQADHQLTASVATDRFPLEGATAGNPYTVKRLFNAMEAYRATKQKLSEYDKVLDKETQEDCHAGCASPIPLEDPSEDPDVQSWVTAWREKRAASQKVPFKKRLEETDARFRDQLAVHREMNHAFSQVAQMQKEVQVMKAEKRTTTLVSTLLQKQNEQLLRVFPTESPFWKQMEADEERMTRIAQVQRPYVLRPDYGPPIETQTAAAASSATRPPGHTSPAPSAASPTVASPNAVDPMLQEILNQFSKPKNRLSSDASSEDKGQSERGKRGKKTEPPAKKTLASISVQPVEPAPTPYVRIRYVLRKEPQVADDPNETVAWASPPEKEYEDDFDDDIIDEAASNNGSQPFNDDYEEDSIASEEGAEEDIHRGSYDSGVIDEGDDISAEDSSENDFDSDGDIEDESDNISSEDGSTARQRKKREKSKLTTDEVASLKGMLKEFYAACRNTNALGKALLEGKRSVTAPPPSHGTSTKKKKTDISSSSAGITDKEDNIKVQIEKEFADIRRLRRFNKRIQDNMKAVDLQRKAHEAKKRLLDKAVRLSKAVKKQRRNPKTFIKDMIEDEDDQSEIGSVLDSLVSGRKRKKGKAKRRAGGGSSSGSDIDDIEDEVISDYDLSDFDNGSDDIIDDESAIADDDSAYGSDDFIEDDEDDDDIVYDDSEMGSDGNGSIEDEMEDMVEDDAYTDNFDDEVESDAILDEEEEGLIERLASVSDVEDLASSVGLENLATGSEQEGEGDSIADEVASEEKNIAFHSDDDEDAIADDASDEGNERAAVASSSHSPSSLSSSSRSAHASDGDISSPYPSSHPSVEYELNSSERSQLEAEDGEEALREMEEDLRLTASRRQRALAKVGGADASTKPFVALYDPTFEETTEEDDDDVGPEEERLRLKSMLSVPPSRRTSSAQAQGPRSPHALPPPLFATEECLPSLRATEEVSPFPAAIVPPAEDEKQALTASPRVAATTRKQKRLTADHPQDSTTHYLADDLVALNEWKRRQKELIRQLFTPSIEATAEGSPEEEEEDEEEKMNGGDTQEDRGSVPRASEADYHWGQLEALLETRFGAAPPRMDKQQYDHAGHRRFLELTSSSEDDHVVKPHDDDDAGVRKKADAYIAAKSTSETITGSEKT